MKGYQRFLKNPWAIVSSLTIVCVGFFSYAVLTAPPTIEAANLRETANAPVDASSYALEGTVSPSAELTINDQKVTVQSNGRFSYTVPLSEGDNTITMTLKKNGKTTIKSFSLYRYTKDEVAKRKAESDRTIDQTAIAEPNEPLTTAPVVPQPETSTAPEIRDSFGDGTFTIGTDIAAGTYRTNNPGTCHYESLSMNGSSVGDMTTNGGGEKEITITISPNDTTFISQGCGTWIKID